MMGKKLVSLIVALAMIIVCGIPVFATNGEVAAVDGDKAKTTAAKVTEKSAEKEAEINIAEKNQQLIDSIIKDANGDANETGLVTIRKPEDATVTTCKEAYTLSGETEKKSVRVYLAKYNEDSKAYELFANSDGESSWDIGSFGKYAKGITLSKGANKLKLVAYKVSDKELLKAEDVQVSKFTINYIEKTVIEKISKSIQDGLKDLSDALKIDPLKNLVDKKPITSTK